MWATRCVHEATQWQKSCFITLTYAEVPPGNSLNPQDTKNFIERFRYKFKKPFKYFLCGEYGDKGDRPHYHALIFGTDFGLSEAKKTNDGFSDQKKFKSLKDLSPLENTTALRSSELDDLWGLGYTSVGELTFDSAAYTAQYAMKKITGAPAQNHYNGRHPEFMRTSQNAIGKQYALKYASEIITHNSVISNDTQQPIPPYYIKQYEKQNLNLENLKQTREEFSQTHTIEKSYIRAQKLDAKFKLKISKADRIRIRYASDRYFDT